MAETPIVPELEQKQTLPAVAFGPKILLIGAGALLILAFGILWVLTPGGPRLIVESESPDGAYLCRVYEYAPGESDKPANADYWTYDFIALHADSEETISSAIERRMDARLVEEDIDILWPGGCVTIEVPHSKDFGRFHLMLPWRPSS